MATTTYVEKYIKRKGGKSYCTVHFTINDKTHISVGEIITDNEEIALKKAKEMLDSLVKTF